MCSYLQFKWRRFLEGTRNDVLIGCDGSTIEETQGRENCHILGAAINEGLFDKREDIRWLHLLDESFIVLEQLEHYIHYGDFSSNKLFKEKQKLINGRREEEGGGKRKLYLQELWEVGSYDVAVSLMSFGDQVHQVTQQSTNIEDILHTLALSCIITSKIFKYLKFFSYLERNPFERQRVQLYSPSLVWQLLAVPLKPRMFDSPLPFR